MPIDGTNVYKFTRSIAKDLGNWALVGCVVKVLRNKAI